MILIWLRRDGARRSENHHSSHGYGQAEGVVNSQNTTEPDKESVKMHRCPVSGTYVVEDSAVKQKLDGIAYFFCSEECRMRYVEQALSGDSN